MKTKLATIIFERDLKQCELAEKLNISKVHLSNIVRGISKPSVKLAKKLENEFNVDFSEFL